MGTESSQITFLNNIFDKVFLIQFIVSIAGIVLNIPHLFILLQSSMRTCSTNSIMIGIAICDLVVLSENVYERVNYYWLNPIDDPCINDNTHWYQLSLLIGDFLWKSFERTSFWLGVSLALIRLLIMKLPKRSKNLGKPVLGYTLIVVILSLSSMLSFYFFSGHRIVSWGREWRPGKNCSGYPANHSEVIYLRAFEDNGNLRSTTETYGFMNGILRVLVSILYPILALLLFYEILKTAKLASAVHSHRSLKERHRTARMILVMTVFYVISSAPGGTSEFVVLFVKYRANSIVESLIGYGTVFISVLFCLNSTSHGIINFTMSSKYRKTVKEVIGLKKREARVHPMTRSNTNS